MEQTTISIQVRPAVAKAFLMASEQERKLAGELIERLLQPRRKVSPARLRAMAARASAIAKGNGLTDEILEQILNEED